jgi:branched-chain amino acid transport system substrate-binding protein
MVKHRRAARSVALLMTVTLVAAACGDDDDDEGSGAAATSAGAGTTAATTAASETTGGADTAVGGTATTTAGGGGAASCGGEIDTSLDAEYGENAGQMAQFIACAQEQPLAADESQEPFVIGLENSEGDPAFTFPDITGGTQAAVDYINNKLGGIGGNPVTGEPGRPIQLETCFIGLDPADSVRCANELAAKNPALVIQGFNNNSAGTYPVLDAAGVVNIAGIPVNLADYNTPGVYAPAPGGGCVGAHPALVEYAVNELGARRVAVAYFDIPNGRICYHDGEKKPLNILQGSFEGPADVTGSVPDLEQVGVAIPPDAPDLTTQATQILDFDPDAILYSAPAASCVSLVNALAGLGWTTDDAKAVFTGACFNQQQIEELGNKANGMIFVGAPDPNVPDAYPDGLLKTEAEEYAAAMEEYAPDVTRTGFAGTMFQDMLLLWHVLTNAAAESGADALDHDTIVEAIGSTVDHHMWAASPVSCGAAVEGYSSICNTINTATEWDAATKARSVVDDEVDGTYIIAGTELDPEVAG